MIFKLEEKINHPTYLFHGTNMLGQILKSNTLMLGNNYGDGRAVCMTRDFNFAKKFKYIIVLNRDKLKQHYKIELKSDSKNMNNKYARNLRTQSKAEEVIKKDITNLLQYVEYIVTDVPVDNKLFVTKKYFMENIL
jgi:hypothetical protein